MLRVKDKASLPNVVGRLKSNKFWLLVLGLSVFAISFSFSSCGVYGFSEKTTLPDSVKTLKLNLILNAAPYVNPQVSPNLTEKLRQKITNQTRLSITNNENANWEISGTIADYSVTTTGVTSTNGQQQSSINRLTVRVHIILNKRIENKQDEFDVSRSFDFAASQSLQTAEASLLDEMIKNLTDEIFNHIFSNW
ncbi:MAG: LPS assembly lipoprotein LptE [Bacteroidota bacterium]|nr:LPS assembly lipoprotein LptE [Bacteroidota bacterium]